MTDPGVPHTSMAILHPDELFVDTEEDIHPTKLEEDLPRFQLLFKVSEVLRLHGVSPDAKVTKADFRRTKFTLEGGGFLGHDSKRRDQEEEEGRGRRKDQGEDERGEFLGTRSKYVFRISTAWKARREVIDGTLRRTLKG
jgi:hypothetical protein